MHSRSVRCALAMVATMLAATPLAAGPRFSNAEYAERRARLMAAVPDGVAVIWGAQTIASYYRYAQNNDFMYLTGAEIPNAVLIVDGVAKVSTLVFTSTEAAARNDGINAELVRNPLAFTGIERVAPIESLDALLAGIASRSKVLYTSFRPAEHYREASLETLRTLQKTMMMNTWDGRLTRELQLVKLVRERFPQLEVRDCSGIIWELRTIKSPAEIELLRRAGRIGAMAHTALLKAVRPGMYEYELSALFNYICEKEGAQESAYGVIISSGENHPYVHYNRHDRQLKDGDFLVVDAGPDLDYYDIDISTSFPANGTFTPRQREVYEASLAVHEANLQVYRPGLTLEQCRQEVEAILLKRGFDLTKDYFKRMRGGFGHYVGMATHDVGGGPQVLKPGMVFANEPYMTWPGEDLGVRVENTILITETGCENLTPGIPRSIKEIEEVMRAAKQK
jgi:Xaa-Pro aminopeptidase